MTITKCNILKLEIDTFKETIVLFQVDSDSSSDLAKQCAIINNLTSE